MIKEFPLSALDRNLIPGSTATHAHNLRPKNGSLQPLPLPSPAFVVDGQRDTGNGASIDYVHSCVDGYRNFLSFEESDGKVFLVFHYSSSPEDELRSNPTAIADKVEIDGKILETRHMGNTLIILTDKGIRYFLFKDGKYRALGSRPPRAKVEFRFDKPRKGSDTDTGTDFATTASGSAILDAEDGFLTCQGVTITNDELKDVVQMAFLGRAPSTDASALIQKTIDGSIGKMQTDAIAAGLLPNSPLFIRYALRMFDGSHTAFSPPLMIGKNGIDSAITMMRGSNATTKWNGKRAYILDGDYVISMYPNSLDLGGDAKCVGNTEMVRLLNDGKAIAMNISTNHRGSAIALFAPIEFFNTSMLTKATEIIHNPCVCELLPGSNGYGESGWQFQLCSESWTSEQDVGSAEDFARLIDVSDDSSVYSHRIAMLAPNANVPIGYYGLDTKMQYVSRDLFNHIQSHMRRVDSMVSGTLNDFILDGNASSALSVSSLSFKVNLADYSNWEDVITGLDIFISKQIPTHALDLGSTFPPPGRYMHIFDERDSIQRTELEHSGEASAEERRGITRRAALFDIESMVRDPRGMTARPLDEVRDQAMDCGEFYLLKRINFAKKSTMPKDGQWTSLADDIKKKFPTIEMQEKMDDDYGGYDELTPRTSYVYNQSLHIADIETDKFEGFSLDDFIIQSRDIKPEDLGLNGMFQSPIGYTGGAITANYKGGESSNAFAQFTSDIKGYISPMLYVPDVKAKDILVGANLRYIEQGSASVGLNRTYFGEFELDEHNTLNGSMFMSEDLKPITLERKAGTLDPQTRRIHTLERNKIMATPISNVFTFDPAKTNFISSGAITALHAAIAPLPTGETGMHPLYVFTTEGIFYISVNNNGTYQHIQPVNFDILTRKDCLCATSGAIIYGTLQGLKYLHGINSTLISAPLDGKVANYMGVNPTLSNLLAKAFVGDNASRLQYLKTDFKALLDDPNTGICFDYANNELLVYNLRKDKYSHPLPTCFAYAYNLNTKTWYTRTLGMGYATKILPCYPDLFVLDDQDVYNLCIDSADTYPFFYATNPIGGYDMVKIDNFSVNIDAESTSDISVNLTAGNNPFRLSNIRTRTFHPQDVGMLSALPMGRIPSSVRYFSLAIFGRAKRMALRSIVANVTSVTDKTIR